MKIQTTVGEVELKPCPFCGGENIEVRAYGNDRAKKRRKAEVKCKDCVVVLGGCASLTHTLGWCIEKVTENWNMRKGESDDNTNI